MKSIANTRVTHLPTRIIEPQILTILATYKCTAACKNCCFGSNPTLTARITLEQIKHFIDEGVQFETLKQVVFSGGECFLLGDDLVSAVHYANSKGLLTRCVTNGYWAKSIRHGREKLTRLKEAGLNELNISTGDYHQQFVGEDSVINAAMLGVELKLDSTLIVVELQKERKVDAAGIYERNQHFTDFLKNYRDCGFKMIESPWMPMNYEESINQTSNHLLTKENYITRGGCDSVFTTIVINPKNQVGLCCGLSREHIPELNSLWDGSDLNQTLRRAGKDFMKIWLYVDGPEKILAWAAGHNSNINWENRYSHHCHACLALFKDPLVREVIRTKWSERKEDVLIRYSIKLNQQYFSKKGILIDSTEH